jgi:solute:Na+ symporter, SSS family
VKIPLQALILFMGVLVFVFYLFARQPMLFNPQHDQRLRESGNAAEYAVLQSQFDELHATRERAVRRALDARLDGSPRQFQDAMSDFRTANAAMEALRQRGTELIMHLTRDEHYSDVNYVFPTFVITHMPVGLVGLMIAAIFAAAMSSIAAELNALSAATVIDFYRRHVRAQATDRHYLIVSRVATGVWGLIACVVAVYATTLGSLIEVVNRFGSFFYGSLLGVFVLAIGTRRANSVGASVGLLSGMAAVCYVALWHPEISFLWHNVVGVAVVVVVGLLVSAIHPRTRT